MTFIRYIYGQNIGQPINSKVFGRKEIEGPKKMARISYGRILNLLSNNLCKKSLKIPKGQ
jgi:hypothetical protein